MSLADVVSTADLPAERSATWPSDRNKSRRTGFARSRSGNGLRLPSRAGLPSLVTAGVAGLSRMFDTRREDRWNDFQRNGYHITLKRYVFGEHCAGWDES
jgi:hypothetical protein